ncbi:MAG: DUF3618 domain-containing protein [Pseudomonadota bacterium]
MTYHNNPEALEDEIEATRNRIESRLENLTESVAPSRLLDNALGSNAGSAGDSLNALITKAKSSPVSAALIGAGLVSLFLAEKNDRPRSRYEPVDDPHVHGFNDDASAEERLAHNAEALKIKARGIKTNAAASASDLAESATDNLKAAKDSVVDTVSSAKRKISEAAAASADRAADLGQAASTGLKKVSHSTKKAPVRAKAGADHAIGWAKENPVPAGLMALAAGAGISALLTSRKTNRPSSALEASRSLHEEARSEEVSASNEIFDDVQPIQKAEKPKAKAASKKKTAAKKRASTKKTSSEPKAALSKMNGTKNLKRSTAVLGVDPNNAAGATKQ